MTMVPRLACPRCLHTLRDEGGSLRCTGCTAVYAIRDGIPDLLPWSGGAPGPEWARWREKLDRLQAWRRDTWNGSSSAQARQRVADDLAVEFFDFAAVPEGATVLDIGCGGGQLRHFLPDRSYVGVDPLPVLPLDGSPPALVRGVGERLPVAEEAFDAVLLCETLDHSLDPGRVLDEARRALRPGGVLAVMQSVAVESPRPPLTVRLRAAGGRLKARLAGKLPADATGTKMHVFTPEALRSLVSSRLALDASRVRGGTLFLRALKAR